MTWEEIASLRDSGMHTATENDLTPRVRVTLTERRLDDSHFAIV